MTIHQAPSARAAALGPIRFSPKGVDAAAELEALGFQTVWSPGGLSADIEYDRIKWRDRSALAWLP